MMSQKKRYVIWQGSKTGIFRSRDEARPLVSGIKNAKYKSFPTKRESELALQGGREPYYQAQKKRNEKQLPFIKKSIAVDAGCSSASKVMEYQGIDLVSEQVIFSFRHPCGTNNIGEFLAIVHGLSWLQKEKKTDYVLYSDSKIAINWVKNGKCKTNFPPTKERDQLFGLIKRAEQWLANSSCSTIILKRNTAERGEIPADFGRK